MNEIQEDIVELAKDLSEQFDISLPRALDYIQDAVSEVRYE